MSALNSGLFLVSAVASRSGLSGLAQESFKLRSPKRLKKRERRADPAYAPLSPRKKEELMKSILRDDWHE